MIAYYLMALQMLLSGMMFIYADRGADGLALILALALGITILSSVTLRETE